MHKGAPDTTPEVDPRCVKARQSLRDQSRDAARKLFTPPTCTTLALYVPISDLIFPTMLARAPTFEMLKKEWTLATRILAVYDSSGVKKDCSDRLK